MFPIKNIRKDLTERLDEITVLRKFRNSNGTLIIKETNNNNRKKADKIRLLQVEVESIPIDNVWIFENEFGSLTDNLTKQKGAFTSAGKKVEKTIIYYDSNRLYLFMIEMKRTISPQKMQADVIKKFEQSLSTLSVFIAAHYEFPQFTDAHIYPVGICCYNYYDESNRRENNDPKRIAGMVRKGIANIKEGDRIIYLPIEPIALNKTVFPVFFLTNPNRNPVTDNFTIELDTILNEIENIGNRP